MSATITAINERLSPRDPLEIKLLAEPATIIILPVIRIVRPAKRHGNYAEVMRPGPNEPLPSDSEP